VTEYVAGFLIAVDTQQVVLVRKDRPAWQAGRLNGVGGHIEPGETPEEAMRREFCEEAGLDLDGWEHFATVEGDWGSVRFFRLFSSASVVWSAETQESEPIERHPVDRFDPDMLPNLSWLLPLATYRHDGYAPVVARERVTVNGGDDPPPATAERGEG
jgi:8-oxo-dGTP diphosphatase